MNTYLTNLPPGLEDLGLCKTFLVRRETINIKHIMTEIFVRKTYPINQLLDRLSMTPYDYMEYMTNRLRHIYKFQRTFRCDSVEELIRSRKNHFFPQIEMYKGLHNIIVLDFDGTTTKMPAWLYNLCVDRAETHICTGNPTVSYDWWDKHKDMRPPVNIHAMKGKTKKMRRLLALNMIYDNIFYVDNEPEYLLMAWAFGIKTFLWDGKRIKYFTQNTK